MKTHKPSLADVVAAVNEKLSDLGKSSINYNIEIKRKIEWDHSHHPPFQEFADILIREIYALGIADVSTVQCFDIETLKYLHRKYPDVTLVLLIANQHTPQANIADLGFVPEVYSPYFKLVDAALVSYCRKHSMKLIPWTVNENSEIEKMVTLGVDGIISDYPDRVIKIVSQS